MIAPKPTPRSQNWQVQDLEGGVLQDGLINEAAARDAALVLRVDLQIPVRVRRTV